MKRMISILLIFFLLMGFSACHTQGIPPRSFHVNSIAALKTLLNAAQLSDADFAEFSAQAWASADDQIHILPDTKKQEVEELVQIIETVGIPVLKDHAMPESFHFEYRPGYTWIDMIYRLDDMRYRFCISPTKNILERIWNYLSRIRDIPVATWKLDEDTIVLYRNWQVRQRYGVLYRNGYTVSIDLLSYTEEPVAGFPFVTSAEFVWRNTLAQPFAASE